MYFDAVLFEGEDPFDMNDFGLIHRLNGLTLEEVQALENLLSKGDGSLNAFYYYMGD